MVGEPDGKASGIGLFKEVIVWRRLGPARAVRYVCFEDVGATGFCVQSADFLNLPLDPARVWQHEMQMLELLIEEEPSHRGSLHPTLAAAIEQHDADFQDMPGL